MDTEKMPKYFVGEKFQFSTTSVARYYICDSSKEIKENTLMIQAAKMPKTHNWIVCVYMLTTNKTFTNVIEQIVKYKNSDMPHITISIVNKRDLSLRIDSFCD